MESSIRVERWRGGRIDPETRTPSSVPDRVAILTGLGIAAAGIFLRVWQLDALGFNSDEAVYAGQAASIAGAK